MTITKITYMQTFPTGSFANIKLGAEAEVGVREDITQAMTDLKKAVNDAFQAINPLSEPSNYNYSTSYDNGTVTTMVSPKSEEQISREEKINGYHEIIIMAASTKQLEMHRGNIEKLSDEALTAAFNNKINQLQ